MSKSMVIRPKISEKAYGLSLSRNTYVFQVPKNANKLTVADAVKSQFDVTVIDVNMMNIKGKVKRTVRRGGRSVNGKRSDIKKAYVTLKEGDSLAIFASEEPAANDSKNPATRETSRRKK